MPDFDYVEHQVHEIDGFRIVDATATGQRGHDDLIWVGYGGMEGRWMRPELALELAAAIVATAQANVHRRKPSN